MSTVWIDRPFGDVSCPGHDLVGPADQDMHSAAAVVVGTDRWDGPMMDRVPGLRVIARTGIGFDSVDLGAATRRGIAVTNTPDGPTVSTAEHAIALMFAAGKTLPRSQGQLRKATGNYTMLSTALEFNGLTLGLYGYGRVARRVAVVASAVGMKVLASDPFVFPGDLADDAVKPEVVGFDELCQRSDVLSLHAPLAPDTAQVFNAEAFAACKPGVVFVNTSRGGLVDHDALLGALHSGQVSSAGLDVTDPEPLGANHGLLNRDDVIVTPHVASATPVSRARMLQMALEQVAQGLASETPAHLVNTDLLSPTWNDLEA